MTPGEPSERDRVLVLARHARSEANAAEIIDTALPGAPLAAEGHRQAVELAERLADDASPLRASIGSRLVRVCHSEAHRTRDTAAAVGARLGLAPVELAGIHEIFGGELEGLGGPEVLERYRAVTRRWYDSELDVALPGGGESGREVLSRFLPALVTALGGANEGPVLVVSHSAAIRLVAFTLAADLDSQFIQAHRLRNCDAVVLVGAAEQGWRCVRWGDVDRLGEGFIDAATPASLHPAASVSGIAPLRLSPG